MSSNQNLQLNQYITQYFIKLFGPVQGPIKARDILDNAPSMIADSNIIPNFPLGPAFATGHFQTHSATPPFSPAAAAASVAAPVPADGSTTMEAGTLRAHRKRQPTEKYAEFIDSAKTKRTQKMTKKQKRTPEASTGLGTNDTTVEVPVSAEAKKMEETIKKQTELIALLEKMKQDEVDKNNFYISQLNEGALENDELKKVVSGKDEELASMKEQLNETKNLKANYDSVVESLLHKMTDHDNLKESLQRKEADFAAFKKSYSEKKKSLKESLKKKEQEICLLKEAVLGIQKILDAAKSVVDN